MKLVRVLLCAVLACCSTAACAGFFDRNEGEILALKDEVRWRVDDGSSFEKVFADEAGWVSRKEKPYEPAGGAARLWARFDLPPAAEPRRVFIGNYVWEHVEYFVVRDGKVVDRPKTGTLEPWTAQATHVLMTSPAWHAGFISVEQVPGSKVTIVARLASDNRFIPARGLSFYAWDADKVREGERRDLVLLALFLGAVAVLVFYNLGVFALTREASYPFYAMHLAGGAIIASTSLLYAYVWPDHPAWNYFVTFTGAAISTCGHFQFARYFLDTRRHYRWVDRALNGLTVVFIALALWVFADYSIVTNPVFGFTGLVPILSVLAVSIYALYRRHPLGAYLFIGTACFAAGLFAPMLMDIDGGVSAELGSIVEGIILSMGLAYRLQRQKAAHEREKREMVEAQNRGLEAKVQERTADLVESQRKSDLLLANILPEAIIDELKANGVSEPRRHEEVSILFTDFAGFTQTVATIPPRRLVQELDELFRAFDDIVAQCGLEKIKTIGDAYMAAGGMPLAANDHAIRCVRAALALVEFIEVRNATSALKWKLRVGVHSGAVVAGIVGKNKYAYDVWGDTVNIASRLESAGEPNRVNVSAYTFELIRDRFECEYRGKLAAKGKGEIDMYFVLRERG